MEDVLGREVVVWMGYRKRELFGRKIESVTRSTFAAVDVHVVRLQVKL